jgi:Leucine-rich repeat (LRR) protein
MWRRYTTRECEIRNCGNPTTKSVKKPKKTEAPQKLDNRTWWNQMDKKWQQIFRNATDIHTKPTDDDLVTMISLQKLNCSDKEISDLEPLRQLTNLQELSCSNNKISDLESLRPLNNLQELSCSNNKISDLEPLRNLTNLEELNCKYNKIGWWHLFKFKRAMPNCKVNK